MKRPDAIRSLQSPNPRVRLEAARYLSRNAEIDDSQHLARALQHESVAWIRAALENGLKRLEESGENRAPPEASEAYDAAEWQSRATVEVSGQILHELEPLIGVLRLRLLSEWREFSGSQSDASLRRIETFLGALRSLNTAARVPVLEDVKIAHVMQQLLAELTDDERALIAVSGPDLSVLSNGALLQLIVRNGLRNALEVTDHANNERVVVSWGRTAGSGYFISVVDKGPGPPIGAGLHAFDLGSTTKPGHLGMGLAIASQAANALLGSLVLRPAESGGAVLEFRSAGSA